MKKNVLQKLQGARQDAVSPVVGVMLMLVVTIIIAAVVSAFAGGALGSSSKTPQATIKGVFSQSGGMQIIHSGGDSIQASSLLFTVTNDGNFGQGLSSATVQILNKQYITDVNGNALQNSDGTTDVTVFAPGQTLYINRTYINPVYLQPQVADGTNPTTYWDDTTKSWDYSGTKTDLWNLCFIKPASVGKSFTLTMSDKSTGAIIAKTTVVIAP